MVAGLSRTVQALARAPISVPSRMAEMVRRVIEQVVAAPLRLQHQREGRIAADVDPRDVVHLDGDFERHGALIGEWG